MRCRECRTSAGVGMNITETAPADIRALMENTGRRRRLTTRTPPHVPPVNAEVVYAPYSEADPNGELHLRCD
jgi:hypothetical protein